MDIRELKELVSMMKESGLTEILIVEEGRKVRLRKQIPAVSPNVISMPGGGSASGASSADMGGVRELPPDVIEFKSPMVGTFYRAPSPESEPYSHVGDKITPSSVICIIEAMKVMNEIKAETEGEILEILAENGEAVEYGQPLFLLRRLA